MIATLNPYAYVPIAMAIWGAAALLLYVGAIALSHVPERGAKKSKEDAR